MSTQNIYTLDEREYDTPYYNIQKGYKTKYQGTDIPIVIDNGSNQCRAGWASNGDPNLVFENVVSRYKDRKADADMIAVGMDTYADPAGRSNARSPFNGNVVCDFDRMETILDYIFVTLGINTSSIDHPLVMTEPACIPQYSRKHMSELLFEGYGVPKVTYGIDSLFSFYANGGAQDGVVISAGHSFTHVIPVLHGKGLLERTKRISYGGSQSTEYMLQLMQLKYPTFPAKMTNSQAQELVHNHAYIANDYHRSLSQIENRDTFVDIDHIIQFPFTAPVIQEKTQEELARQAAKREENAKRLRDAAAKSRLEKLVKQEQEFEEYSELKESKKTMTKKDWITKLKAEGFKDEAELDSTLKQTDGAIQRARNKELGIEENEEKEPPVTTLIDIPDEELSEADKKEKQKQKMLKGSYDARQRAKKAKEEAKARDTELARLDEERRIQDPAKWVEGILQKRQAVLERMKKRKRLMADLADRRSRASQLRMRSIATLVTDNPTSKRRRKGQEEDTFGADEEDWRVYQEISRIDESEEEEEDLTILHHYESQLLQHDPDFLPEHLYEAMSSSTNTLMHLLARGQDAAYDPTDIGQMHQLHVNVERVRVGEVLFQPSIVGLDQAGLEETVNDIVKTFDSTQKNKIMKTVFLTGGFSKLPGLQDRMTASMRTIFPADTSVKVKCAKDPQLDAWRGAAKISQEPSFKQYYVSKKEYEEYGGEYIKEHDLGNAFYTTQ